MILIGVYDTIIAKAGFAAFAEVSMSALEGGVVGVTLGSGGVEGGRVGSVERGVFPEAGGQVWICDEELAEGHCVGFAFVRFARTGTSVLLKWAATVGEPRPRSIINHACR